MKNIFIVQHVSDYGDDGNGSICIKAFINKEKAEEYANELDEKLADKHGYPDVETYQEYNCEGHYVISLELDEDEA